MYTNIAMLTNQTLLVDSIDERAAVVAKGRLLEGMVLKFVMYVHAKAAAARLVDRRVSLAAVLIAWTSGDHKLVAALMGNKCAHLALVALFADTPDKVLTMGAKSGLLQDGGHEPVVVDYVNTTSDGATSLVEQTVTFGELARVQGGPGGRGRT